MTSGRLSFDATTKQTIYIETTIVSYLTARPDRNITRHSHQLLTGQWWRKERKRFDLFTSPLVLQEASSGDEVAARARLTALDDLPLLTITPEIETLASRLVKALSDSGNERFSGRFIARDKKAEARG